MRVLGIDTSCDDTAAAVVDDEFRILANVVASQAEHAPFGGIVPEIASRAHTRALVPVVREALDRASMTLDELDGVAVTCGPGLLGSLLVGVSMAKSMAYARGLPFVGVNHLEGHLWSGIYEDPTLLSRPFLALIVSGGHTELVHVERFGRYTHLGGTRDDAAGEAFDKVAKLMGLGYPGGPLIDKLARQAESARTGSNGQTAAATNGALRFPVAKVDGYDFSFSGLKTAVRYHLQRHPAADDAARAEVARAFQDAVVEALTARVVEVLEAYPVHDVVLCGGVACNSRLRAVLASTLERQRTKLVVPERVLCTDNGAMIGTVGLLQLRSGKRSPMTLSATASMHEIGWGQAVDEVADSTATAQLSL